MSSGLAHLFIDLFSYTDYTLLCLQLRKLGVHQVANDHTSGQMYAWDFNGCPADYETLFYSQILLMNEFINIQS